MSYILVPELQYWIYDHVIKSKLNREKIHAPVKISLDPFYQRSFINLLFDESYSLSSYEYLYQETIGMPTVVKTRLNIYQNGRYYILCESEQETRINLFLINENDILILDKLLEYRLDPQNTILDVPFDSTAFTNTSPSSDSTSFINYDKMIPEATFQTINSQYSVLYNLIYLYLDFKINDNIQYYDNLLLLSNNNTGINAKEILESCFESFVIEKMFQSHSERTV